jgi:hypothetical protein
MIESFLKNAGRFSNLAVSMDSRTRKSRTTEHFRQNRGRAYHGGVEGAAGEVGNTIWRDVCFFQSFLLKINSLRAGKKIVYFFV